MKTVKFDNGWTAEVESNGKYVDVEWFRVGSRDPHPMSDMHTHEAVELASALLEAVTQIDPQPNQKFCYARHPLSGRECVGWAGHEGEHRVPAGLGDWFAWSA